MAAAARAWWASIDWLNRFGIIWWRCDVEQPACQRDAGLARGRGEQPVVADAVEARWKDVEQEPSDKRVGCQRHDLLALRTITAIILEPEGDASFVERNQPPVGDRHAVGVTRQIGEHRFWASERWLGVHDPALLSDW